MRAAIDLTGVKTKLLQHDDLADIVKAIRRYEATTSILADVQTCIGALMRINDIALDLQAMEFYGAALMTHAVLAYCRATHSTQDARRPIGATKNYTVEQQAKHKKIVDLRNKVIAHYGYPAEEHGLAWLDERVVIRCVGDELAFSSVFKRASFLQTAMEDLYDIARIAETTCKSVNDTAVSNLNGLLLKHCDDPRVSNAMRSTPFEPESFLVDQAAVETFWESKDSWRGELHRYPGRKGS